MRLFVGMILGAMLLTCGVYVYDASSTSSVTTGRATAQSNRTIVNWDVANNEWQALKEKTQQGLDKIEKKIETK